MTNTSTAKRIATILLTLVLLFSMNLFVIRTARAEGTTYTAYFQIDIHRNCIKSKYGVTIYLDGVVVEHVKHGDMITFGATLTDGWHELTFVPGKSKAETRTWKIGYLQEGAVVTCTLKTHSKDIEILKSDITDAAGNHITFSQDRDKDTMGTVVDIAGKALAIWLKAQLGS